MIWPLLLLCSAPFAVGQEPSDRPNLLVNGSFEDGLAAWPAEHGWYESPRGSGKGTSRFGVDSDISHAGDRSAAVTGTDNRGIILQDVRIRPEPHRVSGWIRCEGLGEADAALNVEWLTSDVQYIGGTGAGSITADADWTFISADLTPPENAGIARVECLTNTNNSGHAWFDDIRLINTAEGDRAPPPPVPFRAEPSYWLTGAIGLDWHGYDPPEDIAQYRVYVAKAPLGGTAGAQSTHTAKGSARGAVVRGLEPGQTYFAVVKPVDLYGNMPEDVTAQSVTPTEAGAPHIEVTPLVGPTGALAITLSAPPGQDAPEAYAVTTECAGKTQVWKCPASGPAGSGQIAAHGFPHNAAVRVQAAVASEDHDAPSAAASATTPAPPDESLPKGGDVSGVVVSRDGSPVRNATVRLTRLGEPSREAAADPDGAFSIKAAGARDAAAARLVASAPGYLAAAESILVGAGKVQARLELTPREEAPWSLWAAPPLAQVFQDHQAPNDGSPEIKLLAMRNERECYQLALQSKARIGPVRVLFEDLQLVGGNRTVPASNFSANFVNYVHVDENSRATPPEELVRAAPADFPDELSDDTERTVEPNVTQPVFLTFYVPPETRPGRYEGNVHLATPVGLDTVPVSLEVLPVDFPDDTHLWVVNWFSTGSFGERYGLEPYGPEWWMMLRHYARIFRQHHQNVVTVSPGLCQIWIEEDGSTTYDWSRFDRWCELFLSEGIGRLTVTHLGSRGPGGWEAPEFVLHDQAATHRATGAKAAVPATNFAAALQQHLQAKDWLKLAYQHVADEPIPINVESWKEQSNRIHAAAPKLKRMDAIHVPDLRGYCELWVPQLNYFDQWHEQFSRWQRAGEFELWFYIAWVPQGKYPNRLIDTETLKPRIVHWMSYLYGATGYLHWGFNHWQLKLGQFSPGDEWIVWPGRVGPNSSLRYEAQRDGLEDCEYLHILEDAQREVIDRLRARGFDPRERPLEIGHRIVRSMTDYTRSYEDLQAAREEIAREIVATRQPPFAVVRTEPATSQPIPPGEVSVWGVAEPGCQVVVKGERAELDRDRFLARTQVTPDSPDVTVVVRKGKAEKRIIRHFRISETTEAEDA